VKSALIEFMCVTPDHDSSRLPDVDHLTVHEGGWAYCPQDARAVAHEWRRFPAARTIGEIESERRARSRRTKVAQPS
jgi:hypothetical protein